jgi:hypothetical protein
MRILTSLHYLSALGIFANCLDSFAASRSIDIFGPTEAGTILNGNSCFVPFDRSPARFQQVYDSSVFAPRLPEAGGFISALCLRSDSSAPAFDATVLSIQLNLSTTSRSDDALSATFADNIGPNDTVVMQPQSVRLLGGSGTGFSLCFDFHENPFYYNPANGNLLVDFRIYEGIRPIGPPPPIGRAILDAFNTAGDSVSSVYGFGLTMPTSGQVSSLGLATDFIVTPIPEPSTMALLSLGLTSLMLVVWKRPRKG